MPVVDRLLFVSSKILSKLRYQLIAFKIWGDDKTKQEVNKSLLQLYCRIFNVHQKKEKMEKWYDYSVDELEASAQHINSLLKLPLVDDIMLTMETKLKLKSRKNSILSKIPKEEHDMVLGFLIRNPGLMTRRYIKFINTSFE